MKHPLSRSESPRRPATWRSPESSTTSMDDGASARIERRRTDGIDQLRAQLSWSLTELVQLAPGHLDSRVFRFTAPGLCVEGGISNLPLRVVGTPPAGRASVTFILTSHGRHLVDASAVGAGTALAWAPGAPFQGITPADSRWVTVSTPLADVQDLLPTGPAATAEPEPPRQARMPVSVRTAIRTLLRDLDAWGAPGSQALEPSDAERMTTQWTALLTWALRACTALPDPSLHDAHAAEVVRVAEAYLDRHLRADVYVRDVSMELGVPGRTIEDAFHTILGVSPMRYLEILRAHTVFRSLRGTDAGTPATVHAAEIQAGVRHAARFAARYRALFGENPADTLRRARAGAERLPSSL